MKPFFKHIVITVFIVISYMYLTEKNSFGCKITTYLQKIPNGFWQQVTLVVRYYGYLGTNMLLFI